MLRQVLWTCGMPRCPCANNQQKLSPSKKSPPAQVWNAPLHALWSTYICFIFMSITPLSDRFPACEWRNSSNRVLLCVVHLAPFTCELPVRLQWQLHLFGILSDRTRANALSSRDHWWPSCSQGDPTILYSTLICTKLFTTCISIPSNLSGITPAIYAPRIKIPRNLSRNHFCSLHSK